MGLPSRMVGVGAGGDGIPPGVVILFLSIPLPAPSRPAPVARVGTSPESKWGGGGVGDREEV